MIYWFILIVGIASHLEDLSRVLHAAGFTAKFKKGAFGRKFVSYLGHSISSGMQAIPQHRVKALAEYGRPVTRKQLKAFLGYLGYYRNFVRDFTKYSSVLTPATSMAAPRVVIWNRAMEDTFSVLRECLCNHVVLCVPHMRIHLFCTRMHQALVSVLLYMLSVIKKSSQ